MSTEARIAAQGGSIHEHRKATRQMRWWYESLADFMMTNPKATQNEIAQHFGRAVSTISTIIRTDAFKAYMRQRRNEHAEALDSSVRSKLLNVVDLSLDAMVEKLEKKKDTLPISDLQRINDSALKALGYGVQGPQVVVNNNQPQQTVVVPVSLQDLQAAQIALRNSQRQMIDVTPNTPEPEILEAAVEPSDD